MALWEKLVSLSIGLNLSRRNGEFVLSDQRIVHTGTGKRFVLSYPSGTYKRFVLMGAQLV